MNRYRMVEMFPTPKRIFTGGGACPVWAAG